jgi:hypothetical protein
VPATVVAADDFEPMGSSDRGWRWDWYVDPENTGAHTERSDGEACQGFGYLEIAGDKVWIDRSVDLQGRSNVFLRLYVTLQNLSTHYDYASIQVSENNFDFVEEQVWQGPTEDLTCQLLEFDLSSYEMTDEFTVGIYAELGGGGRLLVDDVQFVVFP